MYPSGKIQLHPWGLVRSGFPSGPEWGRGRADGVTIPQIGGEFQDYTMDGVQQVDFIARRRFCAVG
jgi:hypothetical protein